MRVLVLNSGSSSVKYQLFEMADEAVLAKGVIEEIGVAGGRATDHGHAIELVFADLGANPGARSVDAVGHRVVHGGDDFDTSVVIDDAVCKAIERSATLAPLHNPANLAGIVAARARQTGVPQVAVFDTAFHRAIPAAAKAYALPQGLARQHHFHRFGFHGTSCAWSLSSVARELGRDPASLNLIVAHLGAGASVTAIRGGRSVDTSMGMSPLEGLMMQTRAGDLDPGILLQMFRSGKTVEEVDHLLNHESGFVGICGEGDLRAVNQRIRQGDPDAVLARDMFCHRVRKYIGAFVPAAWPLDGIVFTAGIGENDETVRREVCSGLEYLGLFLDAARNASPAPDGNAVRRVSRDESAVRVFVVRANEELQIARETVSALAGHGQSTAH